jgi:hypothetical protein
MISPFALSYRRMMDGPALLISAYLGPTFLRDFEDFLIRLAINFSLVFLTSELQTAVSHFGFDHQYNSRGFCINCGWEKGFIEGTGRACNR